MPTITNMIVIWSLDLDNLLVLEKKINVFL